MPARRPTICRKTGARCCSGPPPPDNPCASPTDQRPGCSRPRNISKVSTANQQVSDTVAAAPADVDAAVAGARAAFLAWAGTPAAQRGASCTGSAELITRDAAELARIETADCGQVIAQTG